MRQLLLSLTGLFSRIDAVLSGYHSILPIVLLVLIASSSPFSSGAFGNLSIPQDVPHQLRPGEVVTREMKANSVHRFQLTLERKQYVHIVVEQKGIDVAVKLLSSDRKLLLERDSPNGKFGPEALSIVSLSNTSYTLEVSADKGQPAGSYELKIEGPRDATSADNGRVAAEQIVFEAQKLVETQKSTLEETVAARRAAIEEYKKSLEIWRAIGDLREEGYALCSIGEIYRNLRSFPEAVDYLNQGLSRLKDAHDIPGQAFVLNAMGAAHRDLSGDPLTALPNYEQALALRKSIGDRWGQAQLHNNVGHLYSGIGEQQSAIENLELALPLWRELGARSMEMNTLNNIGKANLDCGNLTEAFGQFQEILKFCGETSDNCYLEPFARNSLGVIYDIWAEPQEALNQYGTALKLFREARNRTGEAIALENIGMVYAGLGDAQGALEEFQDALKIRKELKNSAGESIARSNIGYAQMLLGNQQEALKQLDQAQRLSHSSRNQSFEAYTLMRMGVVHVSLGELPQAFERYNQALEIQKKIEDRRGQAITLDKIGEVSGLLGQPVRALENYEQALKLWISVGDRQGQALSLYGIAQVERDRNNLSAARDRIAEAIEKVESLRTRMTNHRLRMTYFAARQDYYELYIDISMRRYDLTHSQKDLESALYANERARARSLLDLLTETHANIRQGVDPQLLERERSQRNKLADKLNTLQRLLSRKDNDERSAAADRELHTLTDEYHRTQTEIRKRSPRYAALTQPEPLKPDKIRELLDDNTILLEYALGEKRSYVWAVTRTDVVAYALPGRAEIEKVVESFRVSLTAYEPPRPGEDNLKYIARRRSAPAQYRQRSIELSSIVLGPLSSKIENKRLVIVADGALQYVPFAALPIPRASSSLAGPETLNLVPLIAKHEVVYQPSASALALIRASTRRAEASKTVAILADPVFDKVDDRVRAAPNDSKQDSSSPGLSSQFKRALRDAGDVGSGDGTFRLERLRYSRREADAIAAAAAPGSWMKAVDFKASRATALSPELKQFKIVHIATHGILNGRHPELSGIVLSLVDERGRAENGFLNLSDIFDLDLPVDLVVLSACRTAMGKQIRGEGLIGMTRGFLHAGASRVVASLWKVDDEATSELMKRFYSNMLVRKLPPAAALRSAQLDMMTTSDQWRAPYYWAGFVLQGEWK